MKKIYLLLIAALLSGGAVNSQNKTASGGGGEGMPAYKTSLGLRFGWEGGLTLKHFIKEKRALEGILGFGWGGYGFRFTGLYEFHKAFPDVEGLDWYFGFGAHIGTYRSSYYGYYGHYNGGYYDNKGHWHPNGYRARYMTLGIDGILGLEYKFEDAPFSISLDIKPYVDVIGYSGRFGDGGLSLRYIIN